MSTASNRTAARVRVELPAHLCRLASLGTDAGREVTVQVDGAVTQRSVIDALELEFPQLQGTIRDFTTKVRRPFIRFFACQEDLSHLAMDQQLPETVATGTEPLLIIGAIAGG